MIISRTPYRISFFGGGTDYPVWYKENAGAVLASTINRYCYITCRHLPPFFLHKYRIAYSRVEHAKRIGDIKHPSVKACLNFMKIKDGVVIHHDGDLPARSGMGSSSSFTVGLLNALYAFQGQMPTKRQLALDAIHIEQEILRENVGSQDQVMASFGGLNLITFGGNNHLLVQPITLNPERLNRLQNHLLLIFTGFSRTASEIAQEQIKQTPCKRVELDEMHKMVYQALDILKSKGDLDRFGKLLHETWLIKKSLSGKISTNEIDRIYATARRHGALGGKLLGAGGGGFMLFYAKPRDQKKIREKLSGLLDVPFRFEFQGSQIVFFSHNLSLLKGK